MAPARRWIARSGGAARPLSLAHGALPALIVGGLLGCAAQPVTASAPTPGAALRSSANERQGVALTVYSGGFALVREQRRLRLGTGRVSLVYEDVSAQIQPQTVHLQSLDAPDGLVVLEQNYRYDLLTPHSLLEKYVGQRLRLARYDERRGAETILDAELLGIDNGPVLRVGNEIVTATERDRFLLPALPASLLERPTLVWQLDSGRDEQRAELSYLTAGLSWHADYVLVLDASGTRGDLTGWVTLDNHSGTSFTGASLALVAGDVKRVSPPAPPPPEQDLAVEESQAAGSAFHQEALFEYHLYSLERPADVLDKEQKQLNLLEARDSQLERRLTLRGGELGYRARSGTAEPEHPSVQLVLDNSQAKGLGMPLPAGVVRVYQADASGALQLVGQDGIDHTPRDEHVALELGEAFEVVARRRQMAFTPSGHCAAMTSWQIELDNHEDTAVRLELVEPANGEYRVLSASHPVQQRDATSFGFLVDVPARGKTTVTYQVRVRWC